MKKNHPWLGRIIGALIVVVMLPACSTAQTTEQAQATTPPVENTPEPTKAPTQPTQSAVTVFGGTQTPVVVEPYLLEGAVTTDTGLQFLELVAGSGQTPIKGDIVTMNLIGSLPDGTEFTNSAAEGGPIKAIIGRDQLLPGWEEGMALMKSGGKAKMVLTPEQAFGEQGYGIIPPNTQIILEVELLEVAKPPIPTTVKEDELTTTESGLQYSDLISGTGELVQDGSIVTNHFTIWVQGEDADEFLFSSDGSDPMSFAVGRGDTVFPGWDEGVLNMKNGGKRLLVIPPDLAFGEAGANGIPANATLIMEVDVVDVREPVTMTEVAEDDYTTTESGLKYYDIVAGEGITPTVGQTVTVHYTGWLEDGQVFDSSVERGEPFSFVLGQGSVIPGWDEGLSTMQVGTKRQLVVPPDLAYGEQGAGEVIPPGATLIFEVELLDIQP